MNNRFDPSRNIKAAHGTKLQAKSWQTEAALRLLMNNLDHEVAEHPEALIVYGGNGRAARNWPCYDKIVALLMELDDQQTLLIQSGKPVGLLQTHREAPRVLIANSNLVPHWATWEHFNELDRKGLMMFGQMTAGSWIYIGSQGIVQGTYETLIAAGEKHFAGDLAGKWMLTAGLGGMGGAQPLAATMAGASLLAVECDESRIEKRLKTGYLDKATDNLDEALSIIHRHCQAKSAISVGLLGNAADILPLILERGERPDLVTDQTSAHDPLNGYLPKGYTLEQAAELRNHDPQRVIKDAKASMAIHVKAMLGFQRQGSAVFDYGNNIRQMAFEEGVAQAFDFPGLFRAYITATALLDRV